ncbi:nad dependent epimerase [Seiridium cupressi]
MPPIDPEHKSRILVTGANGFIGHHIIKQILENTPYQIEATVRSPEKASQLQTVHRSHPRLTLHVVPDITKPEAFVRAAQHCHAIIHLAAPFVSGSTDYEEELLVPSIQGVQAISHAADANESVRRLVYCSSFAAVFNPAPEGSSPKKVYTEEDWNPSTYEQARGSPEMILAYQASKALAEKELMRGCGEQSRWDMVSLCPGIVFGAPVEGSVGTVQELGQSNAILWDLFDKEEVPPTRVPIWTSVTSLAEAHVSALSAPKAGGERFLLINGTFENQELCDLLRSSDLNEASKSRIPVGKPNHRGDFWKADGSKAAEYLKFSKPDLRHTILELQRYLIQLEGKK